MLPVGFGKKVELAVSIPRICCLDCGAVKQIALPFADAKKHYTHALERYVIDLCRITTLQQVAELTGLGWDTVKAIHKQHLRRRYKAIHLKSVRYLAIDEIHLGVKRGFITLVMDLESGRILHLGQGKGKEALEGFWRRLKRSKASVKAVATDMASGFMAAVLEHLPNADLVLDHFHLVKWFNDKLSTLRRQLYHQAAQEEKAVLKGTRWLLLRASENLKTDADPQKDQRLRLQTALALNQTLATAYYMKERLRLLFGAVDSETAATELHAWIGEAEISGIKILMDAAKQLRLWKPFILNGYQHRISTGKLEAMNGRIKTLQRNAYGYRDKEYFNLRIFNLHNQNYALVG
jgi:transposase